MPERAYLSKAVVEDAQAPPKGERWIADTVVKGFGLRIWRSPDGSSRTAFAIRTISRDGSPKRETLSYWKCWQLYERERDLFWEDKFRLPSMSELTGVARKLARDRIDELKGRPTIDDEDHAEKARVQKRVGSYTLQKAAEIVVRNLRATGRSREYCDRLDKLFHLHVPKSLQSKALVRISQRELSAVLNRKSLSPGNMRVLRPFLGRCLDIASAVGIRAKTRAHQVSALRVVAKSSRMTVDPKTWSHSKVAALRGFLRSQAEFWQQAACLEVYLETSIPLSILQAAKITQYLEVSNEWQGNRWTSIELQLGKKRKHRQRLSDRAVTILDESDAKRSKYFPLSEYFFPSPTGDPYKPISSCAQVWSSVQREFGLAEVTPRQFHRVWFEATLRERHMLIAKWRRDVRGEQS